MTVPHDETTQLMEAEPITFGNIDAFDQMLIWGAEHSVSDIRFLTGEPVKMDFSGVLTTTTLKNMRNDELLEFLRAGFGGHGPSMLADGKDIDFRYDAFATRRKKYGFRVNVTGGRFDGQNGLSITCRAIPTMPPNLAKIGLSESIVREMKIPAGLNLSVGPTGSGKSTSMGAILRAILENPEYSDCIVSYEAPIEYVYDDVIKINSIIAQSEIPRHLPSFAAGVRNALRRKPTIINVGEARDRETIEACCEAGLTGHLVFSTLHANSAVDGFRRIIGFFEGSQQEARAQDLLRIMNVIMAQKLVKKTDGGQMALREILRVSDFDRKELMNKRSDQWNHYFTKKLDKQGQLFSQQAKVALDRNLIDQSTYDYICYDERISFE